MAQKILCTMYTNNAHTHTSSIQGQSSKQHQRPVKYKREGGRQRTSNWEQMQHLLPPLPVGGRMKCLKDCFLLAAIFSVLVVPLFESCKTDEKKQQQQTTNNKTNDKREIFNSDSFWLWIGPQTGRKIEFSGSLNFYIWNRK